MLKRTLLVVALAALLPAAEAANPIRKVINLMQEMQKEIEAEKEKEKALFEKFMCICTEYPSELQTSIAESGKSIEDLSSKIEEETAAGAQLKEELKTHTADKASAEKDLAKATMLREKEAAEYESTIASTKSSIEGLTSAVASLEKGLASSLLQSEQGPKLKALVEMTTMLSAFEKQQVLAFLGGSTSENTASSGEVVGILKQMLDDMKKTLEDAEATEKVASQGYADLKEAKDKEIKVASETIEAKEKKSGELAVSVSQNQDALEDTKAEEADAKAMLATLTNTCDSRKKEWEGRLKIRDDEITAISQAISILNDDDALDVFKKAVPSALVDDSDGSEQSGFLQTRHGASGSVSRLSSAAKIVKQAAAQKKSDARLGLLLSEVNRQLKAAQGRGTQTPDFGVVLKMIDEMVGVLTGESEADTKKKEWCTTELLKAESEQGVKQEGLDSVVAELAQITDEIASFSDDVAAIEKGITDIDKEVALSTEQRKKEHSEYVETLQMTEAAVQLLAKAKNRLQKFYNPTLYKAPPKKEATMEEKILSSYSFIQRHSAHKRQLPDIPELPKYEKQNSGGIIALMDKLSRELELDSVEAGHDEKTSQAAYVAFMAESQTTRAQEVKSLVEKKGSKAELEARSVKAKEKKTMTFEELNNAHAYTSELHKSCDFVVENFAARQEARAAEIESLKQAKGVMTG